MRVFRIVLRKTFFKNQNVSFQIQGCLASFQNVRKRGKASFEAEKTIRDAGEKASGLYGAEAWCSMHGPRYDELFAKQARIEREMLGLNDKCELWRAREEMGTEAWSVRKVLSKNGYYPESQNELRLSFGDHHK